MPGAPDVEPSYEPHSDSMSPVAVGAEQDRGAPRTAPRPELEEAEVSERSINVEQAVRERYSEAAGSRENALCCPVDYDDRYLAVIPPEILERDYGCGDPSRHLFAGETVLDLGSGGGKICYIAAQIVGAEGAVIGVDVNDKMLALAESHREEIGDRLGYHNVSFRKGKIQDLALDCRALERHLANAPVTDPAGLEALESWIEAQRRESPLIPSGSVDVVVSNCVLNLVRTEDKLKLFSEIHRVLRTNGRAVISDIVCDRPVPERLARDPELWSGCISGAFVEEELLGAFVDAGFFGVEVLSRGAEPWRVVEGIEFRSITVRADSDERGRDPESKREAAPNDEPQEARAVRDGCCAQGKPGC